MFKSIRNLIMEDEPGDVTASTTQTTSAPPVRQPIATGAQAPTGLNQEMVDRIRKATFSRNTALTSLITASDALVDIIPDPVMRLKAAHKTAGGGRSAKDIADAVAIHLNDVDGEEMRFKQALTSKTQSEVGGLRAKSAVQEKAAQAAMSEVAELTNRIAQLQSDAATYAKEAQDLAAEAVAAEAHLNAAAEEFKLAADTVRAELNTHKNTILSTLG